MSGNEETSEESQVSAETGKERQATLAGGVGFLYLFKIVSLSFSLSSQFGRSLRLLL